MQKALLVSVFGLALTACDRPTVGSSVEHRATVGGTVIVRSPPSGVPCQPSQGLGPVLVFLFDAASPPPPLGAGRPVGFDYVPKESLSSPGAVVSPAGPLLAQFMFSDVSPGAYLITGFMDADENFNPVLDERAQPTAGDVVGGFVDATGRPQLVQVDRPVAYEQIVVTLARPLTLERPAFAVEEVADEGGSALLTLQAVALAGLGMDPQCIGFEVSPRALDDAGRPIDADGDGQLDVWPLVSVQELTPSGGGPPARLQASVVTEALEPLLLENPAGLVAQRIQGPRFALAADGTPIPQPGPTAGPYAVSVVSASGKTWTVPNRVPQLSTEPAPGQGSPLVLFDL